MVNSLIMLGSIGLFFLGCYIAIKIAEKLRAKDALKKKKELEIEFEKFFGFESATEKLLKNLQINNVVKPTLKKYANNFQEACKKESSLQHQIKNDPGSLLYNVAVDQLDLARRDVQSNKTFFYNVLNVAKELEFVPKSTTFEKCLKF